MYLINVRFLTHPFSRPATSTRYLPMKCGPKPLRTSGKTHLFFETGWWKLFPRTTVNLFPTSIAVNTNLRSIEEQNSFPTSSSSIYVPFDELYLIADLLLEDEVVRIFLTYVVSLYSYLWLLHMCPKSTAVLEHHTNVDFLQISIQRIDYPVLLLL